MFLEFTYALENFIHSLDSIGSGIIPFFMKQVIFSLVVFLIILLLAKLFKRLSPCWHLGLWTLVLLRLILPPNLSHSYSLRNVLSRLPYCLQLSQYLTEWFSDSLIKKESEKSYQIFSLDSLSVENHQSTQSFDTADRKNSSWQTVIFSIWLLGIMIFMVIYFNRIRGYQKLLSKALPINHTTIILLLNKWQRQFQIKRKVQLFCSEQFLSPFTMGFIRPKIYVPQNFLDPMNLEHLESIIAHEMAHIKRCDDLWLKIQNLIQIFYFFHPVIWYVNRRINVARECICDRIVLSRRKISSESYGKSIMNILKLNLFGAEDFLMKSGFGNHKKALKHRIKNITGGTTMKHTHFLILYATLIMLGFLILPMAGHVIKQADPIVMGGEDYAQQVTTNSAQQDKIAFICPMQKSELAAPFGKWIDPFTKKEAFHNGIDIAAPRGTEIYAAAKGKVIVVESAPKTHGDHIVLQHANDFQTFYSHCDTLLVQVGQQVKAGELIARVGKTGRVTGPHLHFEIRKNEKSFDPKSYVDFTNLEKAK